MAEPGLIFFFFKLQHNKLVVGLGLVGLNCLKKPLVQD